MNNEELKATIENLEKTTLDLLKNELKDRECSPANIKEYKRWRAGISEEFYQLGTCTTTLPTRCVETKDDYVWNTEMYEFGNHFKTFEEAKAYRENLITKQKLKDLALRLNKGVEIDWEEEQKRYSIYYNPDTNELQTEAGCSFIDLGQVYCLDEKFLKEAKQEIGEGKLIELIKSGV